MVAVPKPKKEPGILKKARMELLAEGNRKAAGHGLAAQPLPYAGPMTSPPAALPVSPVPSATAAAQTTTPAVEPSAQALVAAETPHGAAALRDFAAEAKSPSISPGILLRSQRKVRKTPAATKAAKSSHQAAREQIVAAAEDAVAIAQPMAAVTNAELHVAPPAAEPAAVKPFKKQNAGSQTAQKPPRAKQDKPRKSL